MDTVGSQLHASVSLLKCPACDAFPIEPNESCAVCGFTVDVLDGIIDLRVDKNIDTLLDVDSYDEYHGVIESADASVFQKYQSVLENAGISVGGTMLEIACGSGKLTASALVADCFDEIHCGDISAAFMRIMSERIGRVEASTNVFKYLFDANKLPFKDQSFDLVMGNSVLHHFLTFERTIEDSFRVLKPGGAAIFGEPLFDSHALVSLAAGLIARDPHAATVDGMTRKHIATLKTISERPRKKLENLLGSREHLEDVEDKFLFPANMLRELGTNIGYSKTIISIAEPEFKIGNAAKVRIERIVKRVGLSIEPLNSFQHVFDALNQDYGEPMKAFMHPVFAQVAFVR